MLINRNFKRLWLGQAISLVGDFVFDTTLLLWVAIVLLRGKSYAPIVSSSVLIVVAVAALAVAPVAGVLVDRWDKRATMLRTDLIRFALISGLTIISALPAGTLPVPAILVVIGIAVALSTAASGFFNPAKYVLVGDIVPEERLGKAAGLLRATSAGAGIIGPPIAAPLLVGVGVQWALLINAVSFLVSYAMIRSIRVAAPPAQPQPRPQPATGESETERRESRRAGIFREFAGGLSLFRANRMLVTLLVTNTLVMLGAGAINALDVYFVQENLHADPKWFGLLGGALGVGVLLGSLAGGVAGDRIGHAKVFCGSLLMASSLFLAYSRMTSIWPALVLVVLFSIGIGGVGTVAMPLVMRAVPRDHLGRVLSVFEQLNQIAVIASIAAAGALVGILPAGFRVTLAGVEFGRIDLVFAGSAALILTSAWYAVCTLRIKDTTAAAAEKTSNAAVSTAD